MDDLGTIFLYTRARLGFDDGNDGQISPNSDVILSIIDWLFDFDSTILSIKNDE